MDKNSLESVVDVLLRAQRFKKKASTWYRQAEGALQVVDLQKSSYGMQFYVNLCCVPAGMEVEGMPTPKEHKCPIRIRLTSAFPDQEKEIDKTFDLEANDISDMVRAERVARYINELALPFVAYTKDAFSLREAIVEGRFKGAGINLAAKRHLGILEPNTA
jgi:hypothetical protein